MLKVRCRQLEHKTREFETRSTSPSWKTADKETPETKEYKQSSTELWFINFNKDKSESTNNVR